jgi:hypothetical protein
MHNLLSIKGSMLMYYADYRAPFRFQSLMKDTFENCSQPIGTLSLGQIRST